MQLEAADWSIQATPPVHLQGFTPITVTFSTGVDTVGSYCRFVLSVYCRFRTADPGIGSGEQRHIVQPAYGLYSFLSESSTYLNLPPKQ